MGLHTNNGSCLGCAKIFNKYPGFYKPLLEWFFNVQEKYPEFHVACAGRGKIDQETYFAKGASNARWLESSHNFNAALDSFFMVSGEYRLDDYLYAKIKEEITADIKWYGEKNAVFKEKPHFEVANWKELRDQRILKPVE